MAQVRLRQFASRGWERHLANSVSGNLVFVYQIYFAAQCREAVSGPKSVKWGIVSIYAMQRRIAGSPKTVTD